MSPEFVTHKSLLDNVALYKPAMQSSTYSGYGRDMIAAWAVDGNADPVFENDHCSCTQSTYEPWWAVDLGARYTITKVCLTNRQDPLFGKGNGRLINLENISCNIKWHMLKFRSDRIYWYNKTQIYMPLVATLWTQPDLLISLLFCESLVWQSQNEFYISSGSFDWRGCWYHWRGTLGSTSNESSRDECPQMWPSHHCSRWRRNGDPYVSPRWCYWTLYHSRNNWSGRPPYSLWDPGW